MTPEEKVETWQAEVFNAAQAYLALQNAEDNKPPLKPATQDWFDAGVYAGFLCTMEMLQRHWMLPREGADSESVAEYQRLWERRRQASEGRPYGEDRS